MEKKWNDICMKSHSAYQFTRAIRQHEPVSYFTLWNTLFLNYKIYNHLSASFMHRYKMITTDIQKNIDEFSIHIIHPKLIYQIGKINFEGGTFLYDTYFEPECKISYVPFNEKLSSIKIIDNEDSELVLIKG